MNAQARQASVILDSVARALANWTVDRHVEHHPHLAERYGPHWRADWLGHTESQIHQLSQAMALRSSPLFSHTVHWSIQSFEARGVATDDVVNGLEALRDVLASELPDTVAAVAAGFVADAIRSLPVRDHHEPDGPAASRPHDGLVLQYLEAILRGDRGVAESAVLAARQDGMSIGTLYEQILAPAQARLGRMWHTGEIGIADEHLGSATTQAILGQLRHHFRRKPPNGRCVVATSPPGDLHGIGVRMVADLFELDGWNVIYLGANTPVADTLDMLARHSADLLVLSVGTALTLRDAGDLIDTLRKSPAIAGTRVLIGGPPITAIPQLSTELGADGWAASASEAVILGNRLTAA